MLILEILSHVAQKAEHDERFNGGSGGAGGITPNQANRKGLTSAQSLQMKIDSEER